MNIIWPTAIRLKKKDRLLEVDFEGGDQVVLSAELLRVESPSAEVKGHGPGQKVIVTGKENVAITGVQPVGNYAIRLIFDDGHQTGIYTWDYLHQLGTGKN
jgi:DUF971 family protein